MAPFNPESKYEIKERNNGKSELSGIENEPMVCCHLNHNRKNPMYNDPENGLRVTMIEEYAYHARARFKPKLIGMSQEHNDSVIKSYEKMLPKVYPHLTEEQYRDKICLAYDAWFERGMSKTGEKYVFKNDSYIPPFL